MVDIKTKKNYKAKVVRIGKVGVSSYFLELDLGSFIDVKAGQFISIYCDGLTFRRPFSVFSNTGNNIGILFKEKGKGKGTEYLKSLTIGQEIDIAGPFGNGFDINPKKSLLVGAGIGIAPVAFLKSKLQQKNIANLLVAGFLNKSEIPNNVEIDRICTDDGSFGDKGSILNYLGCIIQEFQPEIIYACGPLIVLKKVAQLGEIFGIETQVAMEKVMACGIGVCRGCVIDVIKDGKVINASVCKDGPVFKGNEVVWE